MILKRYAGVLERVTSPDFMSEWRRDITQEREKNGATKHLVQLKDNSKLVFTWNGRRLLL